MECPVEIIRLSLRLDINSQLQAWIASGVLVLTHENLEILGEM